MDELRTILEAFCNTFKNYQIYKTNFLIQIIIKAYVGHNFAFLFFKSKKQHFWKKIISLQELVLFVIYSHYRIF